MANAVAVDRWSAQGIRLSDVVQALTTLRDQSHPHQSARTSVMTMVAVAPGDEQAHTATQALRALAGHHPARIVLLRPDPDQVASLGARATLYALDTEHRQVSFEEVVLDVGGQAAFHLDSLVEAFTLSDLPVAVWYVGSIPDASDPLLSVATAILVDSRDAPDPGQLRSLLQLARRRTLVDLSWSRLHPWRELLAGLFEPAACRPWLDYLEHAEVEGKVGPRRLLGGWLAAQTSLAPRRIELSDARHASLRLAARREGREATFAVERVGNQRLVAAEAVLPDGQVITTTAALPDDPLTTSLADGLTDLRADLVWERALSAATALND